MSLCFSECLCVCAFETSTGMEMHIRTSEMLCKYVSCSIYVFLDACVGLSAQIRGDYHVECVLVGACVCVCLSSQLSMLPVVNSTLWSVRASLAGGSRDSSPIAPISVCRDNS